MEYEFLETSVSPGYIESYSKLFSGYYPGNKFSRKYLTWLYKENPEGLVRGTDAWYGTDLAAHYVTIPVSYLIDGSIRKGLLSLNTLTHPHHQGKGLFTLLAQKTFERAAEQGYEFVIGVANRKSTPGLTKKLGFQLITPLEVKIGIGNVHFNSNESYRLQAHRSMDHLKWRLANPSAHYFLRGYNVFAPTGKTGISAQMLAGDKRLPELPTKRSMFTLWIGLAKNKIQKGAFVNLPSMFKPSPLNLIFKDLSGNIKPLNRNDIFFELIDFDAY